MRKYCHSLLTTAAVCLLCLAPARAEGGSAIRPAEGTRPSIPPAPSIQTVPSIRPVQSMESPHQRVDRLLEEQGLTGEQAGLVRVRLVQNSGLLDRLEAGTLSREELFCLAQPGCQLPWLEEYAAQVRGGLDPAQAVEAVNLAHAPQPEPESIFFALPNCRPERLERYAAWGEAHPEADAGTVVRTVNMDLDRPFYSAPQRVEEPDSLEVLVNKYYSLPKDYSPQVEALGDGYGAGSLRREAAQAFRAMADGARAEGIRLRSVSAYRSYRTQQALYQGYLNKDKRAVVDTYSARAGHSEHQTGLALDINTASSSDHFERTSAYAWLQANCAQYGFLLRYPQGKEEITGYRFEPWHYRYVGTEIAAACMSQNICYEEYLAALPTE